MTLSKKRLIILWVMTFLLLTTISTKAAYATDVIAISADEEYQIVQPGEWGDKLLIVHNGKTLHEIVPKYQKKIGADAKVDLAYDSLCSRGNLEKQPEAFDDVTGDKKLNIVCREIPGHITNDPSHFMAIRVFSISGDSVEEFAPILDGIGEALHFDDFNNDGVFELVNTDQERYFLYSREEMPISQYVWIFDSFYKFYYQAATMVGEPGSLLGSGTTIGGRSDNDASDHF